MYTKIGKKIFSEALFEREILVHQQEKNVHQYKKDQINLKWKWSRSLTLCDPTDCSLLGSSVHGIFQARILEWVTISFSRRSSRPRDRTWISHIVGRRFTVWATRVAYDKILCIGIDMGRYIVNYIVKFQSKTHRRKRWRKDKGRKEEEKKRKQKRGREGGIWKKAVCRGAFL